MYMHSNNNIYISIRDSLMLTHHYLFMLKERVTFYNFFMTIKKGDTKFMEIGHQHEKCYENTLKCERCFLLKFRIRKKI